MTFKELLYGSDRFSRKQEKFRKFFMYFLSGIFTTLANAVCFILFDKFVTAEAYITIIRWRFDMFLILNQAIAWVAATLTAFFTNRAFVFTSHGNIFLELLGFCAARFSTFITIEIGLFTAMVMVLEHTFGIASDALMFEIVSFDVTYLYLVKLVNSIVLIAVNYFMSKWLVFRNRDSKKRRGNEALEMEILEAYDGFTSDT